MTTKAIYKVEFSEPGYAKGLEYTLDFKTKEVFGVEVISIECISHPFCDKLLYSSLLEFTDYWQVTR